MPLLVTPPAGMRYPTPHFPLIQAARWPATAPQRRLKQSKRDDETKCFIFDLFPEANESNIYGICDSFALIFFS